MINSTTTNTSYNFRAIMSDLKLDLFKDVFTTATPFLLWVVEVLPTGLAIASGTIGAMHLYRKYQLLTLDVKLKEKELKEKEDEAK